MAKEVQIGHNGRMTGGDLRKARLQLGLSQAGLAAALMVNTRRDGGVDTQGTGRTVRRWEQKEEEPVPGPVQLAMEWLAARAALELIAPGENRMIDSKIKLDDGEAEHMGDGVFIVFQQVDGEVQSVVLTPDDLRAMIEATAEKRTPAG